MNSPSPAPRLGTRLRLRLRRWSLPSAVVRFLDLHPQADAHTDGYLSACERLDRWVRDRRREQALHDLLDLFPDRELAYQSVARNLTFAPSLCLVQRCAEAFPHTLPSFTLPGRLTPEVQEFLAREALQCLHRSADETAYPANPSGKLALHDAGEILKQLGRQPELPSWLHPELLAPLRPRTERMQPGIPGEDLERWSRQLLYGWPAQERFLEPLIERVGLLDPVVIHFLGRADVPLEIACRILEAAIAARSPELSHMVHQAGRNELFLRDLRFRELLRATETSEGASLAYVEATSEEERDRSFHHLARIAPAQAAQCLDSGRGLGYPLERLSPETLALLLSGAPANARLNLIRRLAELNAGPSPHATSPEGGRGLLSPGKVQEPIEPPASALRTR